MAKAKTLYFCSKCGYHSPKWIGRCPGCNSWNTLIEEVVEGNRKSSPVSGREARELTELITEDVPRFASGNSELDRVLGGGIVPGAITLLGGDPGIGKSTLLLQTADSLGRTGQEGPISIGRKSPRTVEMRADAPGSQWC